MYMFCILWTYISEQSPFHSGRSAQINYKVSNGWKGFGSYVNFVYVSNIAQEFYQNWGPLTSKLVNMWRFVRNEWSKLFFFYTRLVTQAGSKEIGLLNCVKRGIWNCWAYKNAWTPLITSLTHGPDLLLQKWRWPGFIAFSAVSILGIYARKSEIDLWLLRLYSFLKSILYVLVLEAVLITFRRLSFKRLHWRS